jgi:hypothetical protein
MGVFNTIGFVRDEIKSIPNIDNKPIDGVKHFKA